MGDRTGLAWKVVTLAALLLAGVGLTRPDPPSWPEPAAGQYVNPKPVPSPQDADRRPGQIPAGGFIGARISNTLTQDSTRKGLSFDTVDFASCTCWTADHPTRITFTETGVWQVQAMVTVLGTAYGHGPADSPVLEVIRGGDTSGYVAGDRISNADPRAAHFLDASATDWFHAGEWVEVYVTPGTTVEANWPGRANVSPVVTVQYLGD